MNEPTRIHPSITPAEPPTRKPDPKVREAHAIQLRLAGASYSQIATQLGYKGPSGAYHAVMRGLAHFAVEPATKLRDMEAARLDALMMAHWQRAVNGDIDATRVVLDIMKRRAALLGLDAPQRIDISTYVRQVAQEHGIDPDQAVKDAEAIVAAAGL